MLIEVKLPEFDVELDIRYASKNNFTGSPIYKKPVCYLHEKAAEKLQEAIRLAKAIGYRFRIFDAFRPYEAQWALWNHTPDENYISHPERGSCPHCRGVAIDLTLLDEYGHEVEMGTRFDEFDRIAWHGNTEISKEAQTNRFILMGIMTSAGWDFYRREWWHYQLFNPREFELLTNEKAGIDIM